MDPPSQGLLRLRTCSEVAVEGFGHRMLQMSNLQRGGGSAFKFGGSDMRVTDGETRDANPRDSRAQAG